MVATMAGHSTDAVAADLRDTGNVAANTQGSAARVGFA
ncbi:hypothetical protein FHS06_002625 [Microbacterium halimionae]|nr:hypothetical protein [Microbacterium halimionae]